ncbi:MAG: outer spore coat protein CotE [Kyrpidia sp.]|nr:outer spore coat protein CotE [Kyrpidia sp.]
MASTARDAGCREIITDAVCGRGSRYSQMTYTIHPTNRPSTIGGCWVMNHSYEGHLIGDVVEVRGRMDINVWYAYNNNSETAVAKDTVSYVEHIPLRDLDPHCLQGHREVMVKVVQPPHCLDAVIAANGTDIAVRVEKELSAEVIGRTKLYVMVCEPPGKKDEDEDLVEEEAEEMA